MSAYRLSEREQEVTRLVLQGNSTSQIADELAVSPFYGAAASKEHLQQNRRPQPT
jgi:ATP/maltotriose-dependent transcriptional regulator MalT